VRVVNTAASERPNLEARTPSVANARSRARGESGRPVTVKFPAIDHDCLAAVAEVDHMTPAQCVRASIDEYFLFMTSDKAKLAADIEAARKRERKVRDDLLRAFDPEVAANMPLPPVRKQEAGEKKNLTVRLDAAYLNRCAALGLVYETSVAEQVRFAIDYYLEQRVGDHEARHDFVRAVTKSRAQLADRLKRSDPRSA
jgi:hypothetical protein